MGAVLSRVLCFVMIIALGYGLKKGGLFQPHDYRLITKILFNLTLPAVIISNFASATMEFSLLYLIIIGFLCNLAMQLCGFWLSRGRETGVRAFMMFCGAGYLSGTFTLPFVQSFLTPHAAIGLFMFDTGNALMCNGGSFPLTNILLRTPGFERFSVRPIIRSLVTSTPFVTYLTMLVLSSLNIRLPSLVYSWASVIGNANVFLAMLMIGMMFELHMSRENRRDIAVVVTMRILFSAACALLFYFVLPFDLEIRQTLVLLSFAPVSTLAPVYTERTGGDASVASAVNSITILLSIALYPILLIMMGVGA